MEILVVVVIIAILATVATPLYRKHAQHLRLLDGKTKLLEVMDLEHRYYARALTYTDDFVHLGLDGEVTSARTYYRLSTAACDSDLSACVQLTATPVRNTDPILTLNSQGRRTPPEAWR